jgi:hypothetical protein
MGPTAKLELTSQTDGALNLDMLTPEERARMLELIAAMREIKEAVRLRQVPKDAAPVAAPGVH